jgi:hypothetical protein
MRTTDGRSARATAENADDITRASLGASVLGVTGPAAGVPNAVPPGGGATGDPSAAGGRGEPAWRWQPGAASAAAASPAVTAQSADRRAPRVVASMPPI